MERTQAYGRRIKVGTLLRLTGLLHQAVGLLVAGDLVVAALRDGYVGAFEVDAQRAVMFWYFVSGFFMLFAGRALAEIERERPLPAGLGWWLLGIGVLGGLAIPLSGFWLAVPQGLLVLARARAR